jgi:hypothetical protein
MSSKYAYPFRTAPEGSFSSFAAEGSVVILGPLGPDGTVPTTAAYDMPKVLIRAAILKVAEGRRVPLDDMMVVLVGREELIVVVVGCRWFGLVWLFGMAIVGRKRMWVGRIEAAAGDTHEVAQSPFAA